ncbi:MAG: S41 family peptidase [Muribaculaceae bacterium]|nr:S41 family peptidase [Muribaculaceae bacterium]
MKSKRNLGLVLLPVALAVGTVGGMFIGSYVTRTQYSVGEEKLKTVLGLIQREYVDEVDVDSLLDTLFPELLGSLDPHSVYIPASELTDVNSELDGAFYGVGVSFQILNDTVVVSEVVADGPAEKVGLQAGDKIVKADTTSLTGKNATTEMVYKTLRGPEGTKVNLEIVRRSSAKPLKYEVIRGEVPQNSVDVAYMIDDSIGYVRISKFARTTYDEFYNALTELSRKGADRFVLDLRGNQGGYMEQAILMANEFLPAGRLIVYTKGRIPDNESLAASDGTGSFIDTPVTVLTDEFSASASEILAGALQDNDRALIIGRRTFGKGLVQNQMTLPDSSAIRLTVARYFTPSGRSIQKEYKRGHDGKYEMDLMDRYARGEFYNVDSIKVDKSKAFTTFGGRTVYGGGGIMPDYFVPSDTVGYTSWYAQVNDQGLIPKYAFSVAERYRDMMKGVRSIDQMMKIIPRDETLLNNFVSYAAANGVPARWYYINQSRDLLLRELKAVIARDILGFSSYIEVLNRKDPVLDRAVKALQQNEMPLPKESGKKK